MSASTEPSILAEANPLREHLPRTRVPEPCAIVLFGATGDLAQRKLMPALYRLAVDGQLPSNYAIVGFSRRDWDDDRYRSEVEGQLRENLGDEFDDSRWTDFARHIAFAPGNFDEAEAYAKLHRRLTELDRSHDTQGNRLYYLASAPSFFPDIVGRLGEAGGIYPPNQDQPWSRVVVEKPFGHDLASAVELNRNLSDVLAEPQIYRIDHYLGKETVQNIMAIRFGNAIFEPIWNRRHVSSIQITVAESVGMPGNRGQYYDTSGAIRDMVQNHMMQLLCLVAMEPPVNLSADAVRSEKVKVLQALPDWDAEAVLRNSVRARYRQGSQHGQEVPGYLEENGVASESRTETYVALRLTLDTWRWAGVPFYLRTGKRLPKRATEIAIQFHDPPTNLFAVEDVRQANQLILQIQPDEGASLAIRAKIPGSRRRLQDVRMDFRYGTSFAVPAPEAYERLLQDVMVGDPTLFTRTDEVESAWAFITRILETWEERQVVPVEYPAGSWGPTEADALLERDGAVWRRL